MDCLTTPEMHPEKLRVLLIDRDRSIHHRGAAICREAETGHLKPGRGFSSAEITGTLAGFLW